MKYTYNAEAGNQFRNLPFRFAIWECIRTNHKFSVLVYDKGSFTEIEPFLKGAITFNLDEVLSQHYTYRCPSALVPGTSAPGRFTKTVRTRDCPNFGICPKAS